MVSLLRGVVEILLAVQATEASLVGTVRAAETGQPIAGAIVTLTDLERVSITDANGNYVLRHVPPGPQHITVRMLGYAPRRLHALVPRAGELHINISLHAEPIPLQSLHVRVPVAVRGLESGDSALFPDRRVSSAAVRNHPMLAEPDVFAALSGGEVVLKPESPRGVHVRGGAADQTAYLLDGIPVLSPYHAVGVFSAWNPDAIARVDLLAAPPFTHSDALSGVITATTRAPTERLRAQGAISTTQMSVTMDGPLGVSKAAYLLSVRSGFPSVLAPQRDPSFLRGESGDWLAKIEAPVLGGFMRVLGYDTENEIDAAAVAETVDAPQPDRTRNVFQWQSRSIGVTWSGTFARNRAHVQGWTATSQAGALWAVTASAPAELAATRRDRGVAAALEHNAGNASTVAGVRVWQSQTSYRLAAAALTGPSYDANARTPVAAGFIQHARAVGSRWQVELGASVAAADGELHPGPHVQLRWQAAERWRFTGSYARLHQFAQSLRNEESVVGSIFPADLYIGAEAPGIPVARSDQRVIAAEYRLGTGVRLGLQAYARSFLGLLLVAPHDGEPFSTGAFTTGSGASRGLSFDAAVSGARYGILASYGWQHLRLQYRDSVYIPDHGAAHQLEAGLIVFPTPSSSIRAGVTGLLGRRATTLSSAFEWEACNLLDKGCEFGGSPRYGAAPLGATSLPHYWRVDLGARKHWHIEAAGRDTLLGLFATVTNVFGRRNVLTYAPDAATGQRAAVEMRPRAPLVIGLDWRF